MQNDKTAEIFDNMGNKVPNSWITLAIGYGFGFFFLILFVIIYYLIWLFGANFFTDASWLNIKFFALLSFCVLISGVPIIGIYFAFALLIQNALYISSFYAIEITFWFWSTVILYFLFAIGLFLFNTAAQLYILFIVDYPTPQQKKKNQYFSVSILIVSSIVGLIIILNYEDIFLGVSSFLKGL